MVKNIFENYHIISSYQPLSFHCRMKASACIWDLALFYLWSGIRMCCCFNLWSWLLRFWFKVFYSGIKYTEKDWVWLKVRQYPLQLRVSFSSFSKWRSYSFKFRWIKPAAYMYLAHKTQITLRGFLWLNL